MNKTVMIIVMNGLLTVREASQLYGREESVIRRACINGWIPATKRGNVWFIRQADAEARWNKK